VLRRTLYPYSYDAIRCVDAHMCKQSRWAAGGCACTTMGTNRKVDTVGGLGKMGEMGKIGRSRSGQGKRTRVYVRVALIG
jgi:hypothetical protein